MLKDLILLKEPECRSSNSKHTKGSLTRVIKSSYLDFRPERFPKIENEDRLGHYSSRADEVIRQPYEKEIRYLKNMLETFSAESYFERGYQILKSLSNLVSSRELTQIGNNALVILTSNNSSSTTPATSVKNLNRIIAQMEDYCGFVSDERTEAIVLKQLLLEGTDPKYFFGEFTNNNKIKKILQNTDVIGADNMYKIFDSPNINESCIPEELLHVYRKYKLSQSSADVVEDTMKLKEDQSIISLGKGNLAELTPVDSFALNVVRHSLLGLTPEKEAAITFVNDIKEIVEDLDETIKDKIQSENLNYFEFYKRLKSDTQKLQFNKALEKFNYNRQRQIEIRGIEGAREKWKRDFEDAQKRGDISMSKQINAQCYEWYQKLIPLLQEEHKLCKAILAGDVKVSSTDDAAAKERSAYAPFLIRVSPEKTAVLTLLELFKVNAMSGSNGGMVAHKAISSVGKSLELEYKSSISAQQDSNSFSSKKVEGSSQMENIIKESVEKSIISTNATEWDEVIRTKIGGLLISFVMSIAKIKVRKEINGKVEEDVHPAFFHGMQFANGKRLGVIKIHSNLQKQLTGTAFIDSIQPQTLPMLVEPKKWSSFYGGGTLYTKSPLVRIRDSPETDAYVKTAAERKNLQEIYDGLNVLGLASWTINQKVFDVISHYWNKGEEYLSIPPIMKEAKFPPKIPKDADPVVRIEHNKAVYLAAKEFATSRSLRCDYNYKLEIARGFIGEKLYYPHNLDFRGRAYPISPYLNHLGGDLTRALFLFWEGKELGENGLKWLKIQLANVYGVDKLPLPERVKFAEDNLNLAIKSAEDPYVNDWWTKAEKPWQTLSVCFELAEAYKLEDPTKFVSHLPVHQDGTCNGLQHYAALGGDVEGAHQVNLVPADRPQDVYSYVADLVQKRVARDVEAGNEMAIFFQDKIKRKVVKQTVMTNVYGVTYLGATQQIKKQVEQYFEVGADTLPHIRYLTSQVFASIRELFEGAHLIQSWLGESAKRISKSVSMDFDEAKTNNNELHSSAVIWTSPLGLPCVQPYRINKQQSVKTTLQDIVIVNPSGTSNVDARKQQMAFAPNFIHSLDATHMLMTAKACGDLGINFAAVHDSYWTHATDIDKMNETLRNQFVRLHSTDLIKYLRDEFVERYQGAYQVLRVPAKHELTMKIKEIKKQWAKSIGRGITISDEIKMERKRLQLLASKNPKEVEAGEKMQTTISVVDAFNPYELELTGRNIPQYEILVPLEFPEVPRRGDFDVNIVKNSLYFFS
ncbi:RPO41 [Candida oxycetoniae]|uniref:DNA-directed RNA polymerase n=1 Tax=Candida oxycetoniae TaxID=497107 RepID=A0AAI9STK0_9ASCO|nr:RPO41 [Candida oxycetoniae]KAI3402432.2 RPO41 [Candida oxycetoniae]